MSKCSYCNKDSAQNKITLSTWNGTGPGNVTYYFCSEGCKAEIVSLAGLLKKKARMFLFLLLTVVLLFVAFPLLAILVNKKELIYLAFGVPAFLFGLILFKYPFATPETNSKWGLKKSIRFIKSAGLIFMAFGGLLLAFNLIPPIMNFNPKNIIWN